MKISVVIPTYQRPHLLANCLNALSEQIFDKADFEVIIVSDGPDEQTQQAVDAYAITGIKVRYLCLPEKKGPAAARNYGWLNAKGAIIAFTDDDCIPDKNWLKEIATHLQPDKLQAITGKVLVPRSKRPTDYEQNTAGLETADFITANCACTKLTLLKTGGFDEQFSMAWREDSDLEFKLLSERIPIKHIESAVVTHPVRKASWGISIKEQKKTLYNALLYKKYPRLYRQKIQPAPPVLYYAIILAFLILLSGIIVNSSTVTAFGLAIWAGLNIHFIIKRLYGKSLSPKHIAEMIATSLVIPFVSVYWQWYGAVKYKVLFI
jgi:glycosyltransferase involved in cell wall biosynthesis